MTPLTAGYSLLPFAKYACASSLVRYSRKRIACSRLGEVLTTPAPLMLTCVPSLP